MRHMLFYWRNSHVRSHNWQKLLVNAARDWQKSHDSQKATLLSQLLVQNQNRKKCLNKLMPEKVKLVKYIYLALFEQYLMWPSL